MRYYTSDLHLGHAKIIELCYRPFSSVEDMDDTIISSINDAVRPSDELIIAGDFCMDRTLVQAYRKLIRCRNIHFITGNHDSAKRIVYDLAFSSVSEILELRSIVEPGKAITVCHYAMRTWNKSHRGAWQLYGHSHGMLPDDPNLLSFDIGVDCHEFSPISETRVKEIMARKTPTNLLTEDDLSAKINA